MDAAAGSDGFAQRGPAAASDLALARVVRAENARLVGSLAARIGDLDVAEEAVADAVAEALREWRQRGIPPNPAAWLSTAARHNALDRLRRERVYRDKLSLLAREPAPVDVDERLPLLFGCCHPAIASAAQLALTLRAVCGVTTAQIARVTITPEATIAQRIVRAKRKIAAAGVPLRVPEGSELAERLGIVLTVVSAMYTQAHLMPGSGAATDRDVADDAIWLARVVSDALPREPEARGLLALLLFHRARDDARDNDGELVLLDAQDRAAWDPALLQEGRAQLERCAEAKRPGRFQLQAAIAACHADAATPADTDWLQILTLYDVLLRWDDSPVVRLNRAVALGRVDGPSAALAEVDALRDALAGFHLWHAVRAEMLRGVGRDREATDADLQALELTANEAERRLLSTRAGL
ncbi:RNA polymerase sigma factor [Microbacterium sp. DT81.1]|uniref:RNA polymerase sigma factor n=1 Tax=Microbacterium sp. DT81.1 TaxID=3393413 RepID=UPI003CF36E55